MSNQTKKKRFQILIGKFNFIIKVRICGNFNFEREKNCKKWSYMWNMNEILFIWMSLIVKLNELFYDIPVLYFLTKEKKTILKTDIF